MDVPVLTFLRLIFEQGSYTNHVAIMGERGVPQKNHNTSEQLFSKSGYVRGKGVEILNKMATWFVYGPTVKKLHIIKLHLTIDSDRNRNPK